MDQQPTTAADSKTKELVTKNLPWSRDVKWPVVAIEAAVLIGVGIYILVDKEGASDIILQLIGAVLLATSVLLGLGSLRNPEARLGFYDAFRAGIGTACGLIATASWWSDYIDNHAVRIILGWGLVAYTVLNLIGIIAVRGRSAMRLSTVIVATLTLVLGIVLLTGTDDTAGNRLTLLGVILLVFGALLGALAYYLFSKQGKTEAAQADVPAV